MASVVVAGAIANKVHNGGEAWVRLSWIRALAQLGFDVYFVEEVAASERIDASGDVGSASSQSEYFRDVMNSFGLCERACLMTMHGDPVCGVNPADILDVASDSILVNISGHLRSRLLLQQFSRRVYVDIDPGYTQFWIEQGADLGIEHHDAFFTIGERIGARDCPIPTNSLEWRPIRQPVLVDDWPFVEPPRPDVLTTVASWRGGYGPITHGGKTYGVKAHEFRRFLELPSRVSQPVEVALDIHVGDETDRQKLLEHGWDLVDPKDVAGDPEAFREYVQSSAAEFSVAQGMYVDTNSGWFSDRTTRYLASGRPALVQDSGFSEFLPTGDGLLTFRTVDEAVSGAEDLASDWTRHSRAAHELAASYFAPSVALAPLLDSLALTP